MAFVSHLYKNDTVHLAQRVSLSVRGYQLDVYRISVITKDTYHHYSVYINTHYMY